jgi:anti-sigma regulatory factor (Ser/Thr protein kinase)
MTDRERILSLAQRDGKVTSGGVALKLKISRQAAHRKLQALAEAGDLVLRGAGRGAVWEPSAKAPRRFRYKSAGLAEDRVFAQIEAEVPAMRSLEAAARSAVAYATTEMVNNAIDHASARVVEVLVEPRPAGLAVEIIDDGVGAFARLREGLALSSELEAVQEVSKGKVTTDPARHTGEGIFFTSKVADRFELEANGLSWIVDNVRDDVTVAPAAPRKGTRVRIEVSLPLRRKLVDVFAAWTTDEQFDRTRTVVKLFAIGVEFVSRSEARRLVHGLERFREVVLDFRGVESIGQGFVDEVFRVWATAHPATRLVPQGANETVAFMLGRAGVK